jgi:Ca2+-binding RTX toxin-like protein
MDAVDGGQVVDVVNGLNLTVAEVTGTGWTTSTPAADVTLSETAPSGTMVGTASAADQDGDTLTYSLVDDAGGRFAIDPATGEITVADGDLLDYETATAHDITIRVTDPGGLYQDQTLTIDLKDIAEAPTDIALAPASDGFAAAVTGFDPVAYWRLDGDGTAAAGGIDATLSGAATGAAGPFDGVATTAIAFDGVDDYVEIADAPSWQLPDGTVQLWFNPDDVSGRQGLIGRDADLQAQDGHFSLYLQDDDLVFRIQDTSTSNVYTVADSVTAGDWHHVAVSFGADGVEVFLDGELVVSDPFSGGIDGNSNPWVIGALNWSSAEGANDSLHSFFDGRIAEVAIFDQQLAEEEVTGLVTAGANNLEFAAPGVLEGAAAGTVVGTLSALDPQYAGAMSFALEDDADGRFAIDAATGEVSVADGSLLDYESATTHDVVVRVTDADGDSATETLTIAVHDVRTRFDGTAGNDTILYGTDSAAVYGGDGDDQIDNGPGAESEGFADLLYGEGGNDTIYAGGGDDLIDGGIDDDWLYGESGNDTIEGGDGFDHIWGGDGDDTIIGGSGGDVLYGEAGDDSITGGSGADTIEGGAGNDTINGGVNGDTIDGGDGNDDLVGGAGSDILDGGAGDDTINGGSGIDTLIGGDGSDLFLLAEGLGNDSVAGGASVAWTDVIELDGAGGGSIGTYNTDWTLTLDSGTVESSNTDPDSGWLDLSQDSAGTIVLQDGTENRVHRRRAYPVVAGASGAASRPSIA